ncbi:398_t:CDS:1, partial [Scutellospora calospora]
ILAITKNIEDNEKEIIFSIPSKYIIIEILSCKLGLYNNFF